jgi:hypothetical protein
MLEVILMIIYMTTAPVNIISILLKKYIIVKKELLVAS